MSSELAESSKSEVLQHLQCGICLESVRECRLCPKCCKVFCDQCIRAWITKNRPDSSCPNCRSGVSGNSWVPGYSITQLQESLQKLFTAMADQHEGLMCKDHENQQLSLFCHLCEQCICVKCWFSEHHADHKESAVPMEEAFGQFQQDLKSSLKWVKKRKAVLDKTLATIHENETKLSAERDLTEKYHNKSKNLIVDQPHPRTLMQILETERDIAKLRSDHQDETNALRIDGGRDFVPEPDVLVFRMENFAVAIATRNHCEARAVDRYGWEWRCCVQKERIDCDVYLIIYLTLMQGKAGEWSISFDNTQRERQKFVVDEKVDIGDFYPTEQTSEELTVMLRPTYATRFDQMQDYIDRLEKDKAKYEALKQYLSEWESKVTPSCG